MKLIPILFFVLISFTQHLFAVNMKGYVRDQSGKPISNVVVSPIGRISSTKTDEKGYFNFDIGLKSEKNKYVVFFDKIIEGNWHFKVEILENLNEDLNITLDIGQNYEVKKIPSCGNIKDKKLRFIEGILNLAVPKSYKYKTGNYEHGFYSRIQYKNKEGNYYLTKDESYLIRSYPSSSHLILTSKNFQIKRTSVGLDWQGISESGNHWRYFSTLAESYFYSTDSIEAAGIFNNILDYSCV